MTAGQRRVAGGGWFITGTDTEVGKTTIAAAILYGSARAGHACAGMKPVASGCVVSAAGARCADAELLQANASVRADYRDVNPYGFGPPVAPHLAARVAGVEIDLERIRTHFNRLRAQSDWVIVEGVGGWLVPLNARSTVADLAQLLGLPVILVVAVRLGCLNHALLTARAIKESGLELAGWIANERDQAVELFAENVETLERCIEAPLLGVIPYLGAMPSPAGVAPYLRMSQLWSHTKTVSSEARKPV
jgi:dethiobiotin synthetase